MFPRHQITYMVIIGANNYILQKNMDQIYYVPYKLLINKIRMQM